MLFRPGCTSIADLTHREARTWLKWLGLQWERPSLTDYYIMQNTQYIYRVAEMFSKKAPQLSMKDLLLEFSDGTKEAKNEEALERKAIENKHAVLSMFKNVDIVKKTKNG